MRGSGAGSRMILKWFWKSWRWDRGRLVGSSGSSGCEVPRVVVWVCAPQWLQVTGIFGKLVLVRIPTLWTSAVLVAQRFG